MNRQTDRQTDRQTEFSSLRPPGWGLTAESSTLSCLQLFLTGSLHLSLSPHYSALSPVLITIKQHGNSPQPPPLPPKAGIINSSTSTFGCECLYLLHRVSAELAELFRVCVKAQSSCGSSYRCSYEALTICTLGNE